MCEAAELNEALGWDPIPPCEDAATVRRGDWPLCAPCGDCFDLIVQVVGFDEELPRRA